MTQDPEELAALAYAEAVRRIEKEAVEKTGRLDLRGYGEDGDTVLQALKRLPEEIATLRHLKGLDCWYTQVSGLSPLSGLGELRYLNCSGAQVKDLSPLSSLGELRELDCSYTLVSDLSPLSGLGELRKLNCLGAQVADLSPLSGLGELRELDCSRTQVRDLSPLSGLGELRDLNCSNTKVSDLSPLSSLGELRELNCSDTEVKDLSPLSGLGELRDLNCSYTKVTDLSPLSGLGELRYLNCSRTRITALSPLSGLRKLRRLDCSGSEIFSRSSVCDLPRIDIIFFDQIIDLNIDCILDLGSLHSLSLEGSCVRAVSSSFWRRGSLCFVYAHNANIEGLPRSIFLDQDRDNNHLPAIRAHLDDLELGAEQVSDAKVMVVGNGKAGKTQLCRWMRGEVFDPAWDSTHGIAIHSTRMDAVTDTAPDLRLSQWDFGGQDIYHGAHALFLKSHAVAIVVWSAETEDTDVYSHQGLEFRNHPLSYWLATVRQSAGPRVPLLVVQTQCDSHEDERPLDPSLLDGFEGYKKILQVSPKTNRGKAALEEALREAVQTLLQEEGNATIGKGRVRVQVQLEQMREVDADRAPADRRHRTLSMAQFEEICAREGGVSNPLELLCYLNNIGLVFYREDLFDNQIILDQAWALDAIYAVFNRTDCYPHLLQTRGRFTRALLGRLVWQESSKAEKNVFLDMMQACGICFVHRYDWENGQHEYIAPDLLPDWSAVEAEIADRWREEDAGEEVRFRYPFLHPGLVRAVLSAVGSEARDSAVYWKGGVYVYEATSRSRALLICLPEEDGGAVLHLQTQGGRAGELLERLTKAVSKQEHILGLTSERSGTPVRGPFRPEEDKQPDPQYAIEANPADSRQVFVSYAWGDATPAGQERDETVTRLCADAQARGVTILRDRDVLGPGDRISRFMRKLAQGDRVFLVLSEKYLQSEYCMTELLAVWTHHRREEAAFLSHVRVILLDDLRIDDMERRLDWADHWADKKARIDARVEKRGLASFAPVDVEKYQLMGEFSTHVSEILALLADQVRPATWEDLLTYGLADLP